jgi:hypothetical protein
MTKYRPIYFGVAGGLIIGVVTRLLFGVFAGHSLAGRVFWYVHWPEFAVIDKLSGLFPGHPERAYSFLLPLHFGYWLLIGALVGFVYFLIMPRRALKESDTHDA